MSSDLAHVITLYLPTFSEISMWDFHPGSAEIFEDDTIISEDSRRSPKSSEDVRSLPKAKLLRKRLSTKSEIARKVLSFIHFTHGFRSLHGSELTFFWKLCQARRQQLTFFNQAWKNWSAGVSGREIEVFNPQAWDSRLRRESWQV